MSIGSCTTPSLSARVALVRRFAVWTFSLQLLLLITPHSPFIQALPSLSLCSDQHKNSPSCTHLAANLQVYISVTQGLSRLMLGGGKDEDNKGAQVGSRPPTCNSKCNNCRPCEAVQVPTTPRVKVVPGAGPSTTTGAAVTHDDKNNNHGREFSAAGAATRLNSDYKPEDWKCKCGNTLFNP